MKKNKHFLKLFLLPVFFLTTFNAFSQDPNFYIYLCFGQSNMQGSADIEAVDKTVDSRFQVMQAVNCSNLGRVKGSWYPAIPPLTRCWTGLSPVDYFGRTMVANLPDSIRVGVINVSVAGCKIELFDKDNYQTYVSSITEDWLKNIINEYSGNPYGYLVDLAKQAQKAGVIKGFLLHQGESNTGDAQWPSKVKVIYNNLISDLGLDAAKVPLLAGEVVHADQGGVCASMNSIIAKLPQNIQNSYVISSSKCTDGADNLHFDPAGYRKLGARYGIKMLSLLGYKVDEPEDPIVPVIPPDPKGTESLWFEAERFVTPTAGSKFELIPDSDASNGKYIAVQNGIQSLTVAAVDSASSIYVTFTVTKDTTYNLYARVNCPTADDDSFWMKLDKGAFSMINGLTTSGWTWLKITSFVLKKGQHKLAVSYREDGAKLDKLCISSFGTLPTGMGEPDNLTVGLNWFKSQSGFKLDQNYPNPSSGQTTISFEIPRRIHVSLKVFNSQGIEVSHLSSREYPAGKHAVYFNSGNLPAGIYYFRMVAGDFSSSQKMILQGR